MKSSSTLGITLLFGVWMLTGGCVSGNRSQPAGQVTVKLQGDVQIQGLVRIDKAFTKASIAKAGGGWGHSSVFGVSPVSFTLTRAASCETNVWKIRFSEMGDKKWRGFQFSEGDEIVVHKLYF